jgi:5-hydroxyisourate hydrolase-like protein (transthyretin family)
MSAITTHVLDTTRGVPAAAMRIALDVQESGSWTRLSECVTMPKMPCMEAVVHVQSVARPRPWGVLTHVCRRS